MEKILIEFTPEEYERYKSLKEEFRQKINQSKSIYLWYMFDDFCGLLRENKLYYLDEDTTMLILNEEIKKSHELINNLKIKIAMLDSKHKKKNWFGF